MSTQEKRTGWNRRKFVKAMGLAGLAAASTPVSGVCAAPQPAAEAAAAVVPRRVLGKTGVSVPILNLGGMFDTSNNQIVIKQALKWGINYWDTAEAYGNGRSEEGFGKFLARNPGLRPQVFIVTKLVPSRGADLTERLEHCLARLQTDYVDLFYIHSITSSQDMTPVFRDWGLEMKKRGKIKYFGFSTHTNMAECLAGAARWEWIDAIMFTYNFRVMHDPKLVEAVQACAKAGIGLVAMKTMGKGPGMPKSESPAELTFTERFLQKGFTDKQAKLKVVWENPQIASICSQMPNLTILAANAAAAMNKTKLAQEDFTAFQQYAQETKSGYCAGCGQICQAALTGAVPVPDLMRCLMYYRSYGEPELARTTFGELPEQVRRQLTQIDYSRAEQACPQGLAIGQLMREAAALFA
ncbi:MAG: aldo/keto reductase [Desulfobacca sp.]|uniref:aldo/keto reductase n=1 Tax=Desulfobacca sp. TaxID=2067990 RepID=UPI00404A3A16